MKDLASEDKKNPIKAPENVRWKCVEKLLVVVGPKIQKELIWLRI
jgi:hypothetical protein